MIIFDLLFNNIIGSRLKCYFMNFRRIIVLPIPTLLFCIFCDFEKFVDFDWQFRPIFL